MSTSQNNLTNLFQSAVNSGVISPQTSTFLTGHLGTVDAWVARATGTPTQATEELLRALHTMNGAFAMTELPSVAQALTPGEGYVRRLLGTAGPVPADGVAAIGELATVARLAIAGLQGATPQVPVAAALAASLAGLGPSLYCVVWPSAASRSTSSASLVP